MRSLKIKPEALIGLVYKDSKVMKQLGSANIPYLGMGHPMADPPISSSAIL